jgi:UDPglucose 6-dehydrogenase
MNQQITIGIIGFGVLGKAIYSVLKKRNKFIIYDKYISGPQQNGAEITPLATNILKADLIFLCLPTPSLRKTNNSEKIGYDLSALEEWCQFLRKQCYKGIVVVKSTTMIGDCDNLGQDLDLIHNPEFLTARTATEDFKNQKQIIIGKKIGGKEESIMLLTDYYNFNFPQAEIIVCSAKESEAMKVFVNNFYAMKLQIFNEFYDLCQRDGLDYKIIRDMMLGNGWINPMHTQVPGPDGKLSYGGGCFPKDTEALFQYMCSRQSLSGVLGACIAERNSMRINDNENHEAK